jgi:hypothetical protein
MNDLIEVVKSSPEISLLVAGVAGGLFTFLAKWWTSFFLFKTNTANVPINAAEAAIRMQSSLLAEMRVELGMAEGRFKEALAAQKLEFDGRIDRMKLTEKSALENQAKVFNARIDRMTKSEHEQEKEIKGLTKRVTAYESKDIEYKREIGEWKTRYWMLHNDHEQAKAKLSVYEKTDN